MQAVSNAKRDDFRHWTAVADGPGEAGSALHNAVFIVQVRHIQHDVMEADFLFRRLGLRSVNPCIASLFYNASVGRPSWRLRLAPAARVFAQGENGLLKLPARFYLGSLRGRRVVLLFAEFLRNPERFGHRAR